VARMRFDRSKERNFVKISCVMLVAVMCGVPSFVDAQIMKTDKATASVARPSVTLTLSAVPATARKGQTIDLEVSLKNISQKDIFVANETGPHGEADYDVFVTDAQGMSAAETAYYRFVKGKRQPDDPRFYRSYSRQVAVVEPGKSLGTTIDVGTIYDLSRPGTYKIWVERLDQTSGIPVKSNVVTVIVTP
jgi:hypothetical protein